MSNRPPTDAADTLGHRGHAGDPLYRSRRTLRTRLALLTDRKRNRLETRFAAKEQLGVEVTRWAYQRIIDAYAQPDPSADAPISPP